jgi:hypothetical protein
MIVRLWRGEAATPAKAHAYFEHVTGTVFPSLKAIPGHVDAWLLRRAVGGKTEFLAMTLWTSLEAIKTFSGGDIGVAIVEPEGRAALSDFDDFARHYEVAFRSSGAADTYP